MDITSLILDDHHEQRRLFAILEQIDLKDRASLVAIWSRLASFLEVHAAAEEALFYPALLKLGLGVDRKHTPTEETQDAIKDHNEIRTTIKAVAKHETGSSDWISAIAAVNKANGDHMAEEEREGLTDFRRNVSPAVRYDLGVAFAVFEANHIAGVPVKNQDPARYIEKNS